MDWFSDLRPFEAAFEAWTNGNYAEMARFHLIFSADAPFAVAAGAGLLVDELRKFKLNSPEMVQKLGGHKNATGEMAFNESFLNHLQRHRFRGRIFAAVEGTILMPGEPVLIVESGLLEGFLLKFILDEIVWKSTSYATFAAEKIWKTGKFLDKKTEATPPDFSEKMDWKTRANFIGGGDFSEKMIDLNAPKTNEGYQLISPEKPSDGKKNGLSQIRRCFHGSDPIADIWLTDAQEDSMKGGLRSHNFTKNDEKTVISVKFTRFQNIYHPVIFDGHTAFASPKLTYLRQRTFRNLENFVEKLPAGWLV
jgi:hypothetical protein